MQPALYAAPTEVPNRMSSREIAELTGKRHDNVLRDIRDMVTVLHSSKVSFVCESDTYEAGNGQRYELLLLDQETCVCLLTGYDAASRMRVIQRWHHLENRGLPQSKADALRQLADSVEREEVLLKQLEEARPAVEFFEQVADSKDAIPIADAAKVLNVPGYGQNKLFEFLRQEKILMSTQRGWNQPYQEFIERGYFRVVEQKWQDGKGETRISTKTLVLQKGLDYIRKALLASL